MGTELGKAKIPYPEIEILGKLKSSESVEYPKEVHHTQWIIFDKAEVTENIDVKQSEVKLADNVQLMTTEGHTTLNKDQSFEREGQMSSCSMLPESKHIELRKNELTDGTNRESSEEMSFQRIGLAEVPSTAERAQLLKMTKISSVQAEISEMSQNPKDKKLISELKDTTKVVGKKAEATEKLNVEQSDVKPSDISVSASSVSLITGQEQTSLPKDQTISSEGQGHSCSKLLELRENEICQCENDTGVIRGMTGGLIERKVLSEKPFASEEGTPLKVETSEILENTESVEQIAQFRDVWGVGNRNFENFEITNEKYSEVKLLDNLASVASASSMTEEQTTLQRAG